MTMDGKMARSINFADAVGEGWESIPAMTAAAGEQFAERLAQAA